MQSINKDNRLFYIVTLLGFITLLFSNPFLRYPYDMIFHLIVIDDIYTQIPTGEIEQVQLEKARYLWHYLWAKLFFWLNIDSTQLLLRAKIIHIIQTSISLASIYYFSNVILRNIFKHIENIQLKWLSLWSVVIWITLFATFSAAYHQVWIMWYSVNYQITLPLFWYMLGLTLVLLLEQKQISWKIKVFFILQIIGFSRFILQVHSMEFMYYLMHIFILSLIFIDEVYLLLKKYFYIIIPIIILIIFIAKNYQPEKSAIFRYLSLEQAPKLYDRIMESGTILLNGYNRASASINEVMYFILFLGTIFIFYILWNIYKQQQINIHMRVLLFTIITSMFVLIPLYQFSGGLFGLITRTSVVHRLYYSSSLFVLIPVFFYAIFYKYKLRYLHIAISSSLIVIILFSKYNDVLHHNYYKNILSIKNSFFEKKIGFNLNQNQINTIKKEIENYEKNNISNKKIRYYARADIAFVIKTLFHKNVYWEGRRKNPDYIKIYKKNINNTQYKHILFKIPKNFPPYSPYT